MSLFGVCEFRCGILREVRREKALGFGKGEVEVRQRLHLQAQFAIAGAIEQMATLLAVFREEMEVVIVLFYHPPTPFLFPFPLFLLCDSVALW